MQPDRNHNPLTLPDYKGRQSNNSYHVPACDWYGDAKAGPPKCSGFYHDQVSARLCVCPC